MFVLYLDHNAMQTAISEKAYGGVIFTPLTSWLLQNKSLAFRHSGSKSAWLAVIKHLVFHSGTTPYRDNDCY
ncbi:hypothetical protein AC249_AIPGENE24248 [Exaiptasia diaphana]|nr:hypothetical protein AC249_AIPGENE24248 [Exaiptasia diaphana]